jgi:hypothetical protein
MDLLDAAKNRKVGSWACKSTPKTTEFGFDGGLYFQGTDDKLWQVKLSDPSKARNLYDMKTASSPDLEGDGYVYFQGTDNKLWQCPTKWAELDN